MTTELLTAPEGACRGPRNRSWAQPRQHGAEGSCHLLSGGPRAHSSRWQATSAGRIKVVDVFVCPVPAEPTWHQKPTVAACWPEGRLCGGPRGPWSQCHWASSVSSRRSLLAGPCRPRKFLKLVCLISSSSGPVGVEREDPVPASCDLPPLLLGISAPGNPPNPGGEEGMGTKQLGAATQAVPSPPAPTLLGLDRSIFFHSQRCQRRALARVVTLGPVD